MINPYVDLKLKSDNNKECSLDEAIEKSQLLVLLGAPGSGKTTLLKHYAESHPDTTKYFSIHRWTKANCEDLTNKGIKYVLIDGFDELNTDNLYQTTKPIHDIADKVEKLINHSIKVIISCRVMDWYGDDNKVALNEYGLSANLYYLQSLNNEQKVLLVSLLIEEQSLQNSFWSEYSEYDFLNNPETLTLLVDVYKECPGEAPKTKLDVYNRFIELSNQFANSSGPRNHNSIMTSDEIFRYAGYIAYYCFSVKAFDLQEKIHLVADERQGYSLESLNRVLKTKLFSKDEPKQFQHRTIAEFLCAHFLYKEMYKNGHVSLRRIFNQLLSADGKRVRSELRGVYAWLCTFAGDEKYFKIDPYGQLLYGDNSHFSLKSKKRVLKAIREHSETEPYFLKMDLSRTPKDFYTPELDEFLIQEYRETCEHPNHYLILLSDLMLNAEDNPSQKLQDFAAEVICHPNLPNHYKVYFVYLIKTRTDTLKDLLGQIESNLITDDNNELLDRILGLLYPQAIGPDSILEHIKRYKHTEEHYLRFYYLFNVTYPSLKQLAVNIIKKYPEGESFGQFNSQIDNYIAYFWCNAINEESSDFILNTLIEALSRNWILTRSSWHSAFNNSEHWYKPKEFTMNISSDIKANLYNEWLAHLQQQIDNNQEYAYSWQLEDCISLLKPNNQLELLKSHLSKKNSDDYNRRLISLIHNCLLEAHVEEQDIVRQLIDLTSRIDFKQKYVESIKNTKEFDSKIEEWQLKREAIQKEIEALIQKNDNTFASLSQEEKENAWGYLMGIVPYYLLEDRREQPNNPFNPNRLKISEKTYDELLDILKSKLLLTCDKRPYSECTTISSLGKESPSASRNVDHLYYAITCLNDKDAYNLLTDKNFVEYLYIVSLVLGKAVNIRKNDFCNWFESSDNRLFEYASDEPQNCILKYIRCILHSSDNVREQIISYLSNKVKELTALHKLLSFPSLSSHRDYEECLLKNIVEQSNCQIPPKLLETISEFSSSGTELNNECVVLIKFADSSSGLTLNEVVELHSLLSPFHHFGFANLDYDQKHRITAIMLNAFNESKMLEFHSGFQSPFDECADFVNRTLWYFMKDSSWIPILEDLLIAHDNDIWTDRIKYQIYQLQSFSDDEIASISIQKAKDFIFDTGYANPRDFWLAVCDKFNEIKQIIENSESNHDKMFRSGSKNNDDPKHENECRDVLFNMWNDRYENVIEAFTSREYNVNDDKRVDFTLKYRWNERYHVHVECKLDSNKKTANGIPEQLVKLYLKTNSNNYGIYFVFCFDKNTNPDNLKEQLLLTIPPSYTDRIEVICLDLRKE